MGTDSTPLVWAVVPSVEFAAMAIVIGISLLVAEPLVTVMPVTAPDTVPTVGVVLVVPLYATTLQVTLVAATAPDALPANVTFSFVRKATEAEAPVPPVAPVAPSVTL